MKGTTLRDLALDRVNPTAIWGRVPLLLIQATSNALTQAFLFDTPKAPLTDTTQHKMGMDAEELNDYCLPSAVVIPVRKGHRNSFSDVIVGRASNCDIRLNDKSVSKVHAYMRPPADPMGTWLIWEPAPSTNGTFVDGLRLDPFPAKADAGPRAETGTLARVAPGRKIRFGGVETLFLDGEGLSQTLEYAMSLWEANALDWMEHDTTRLPPPSFD